MAHKGHFGTTRKLMKLRAKVWRINQQKAEEFVDSFLICNRFRKRYTEQEWGDIKKFPFPGQVIRVDMVGPLPKTNEGYEYLVTIIDFCSRFSQAILCHRVDAATVMEVLNNRVFIVGQPELLVIYRGTNFKSIKSLKCIVN